jgi:SNF2 family DNA or RNA helicase
MIVFHAIWTDGTLHLWAEQKDGADSAEAPRATTLPSPNSLAQLSTLGHDELRGRVGDLWDSLLISGAGVSELTLHLPHRDGRALPCWQGPLSRGDLPPEHGLSLQPYTVPTLTFSAADAVDLLTGPPSLHRAGVRSGASLRFWMRVADLVLELLAKQRFVPALHRISRGRYRGYWRTIVEDAETSKRLHALIVSMPPVCRATRVGEPPVQAFALIEDFLWTTADALVRRCLEGDELAYGLSERGMDGQSPQIRWLRSLVSVDPTIEQPSDECEVVCDRVQSWLSRLEPPTHERTWKTCFRLHAPADDEAGSTLPTLARPWQLSIHVQATQDPTKTLDAESLLAHESNHPTVLKRPFLDARGRLRADIAHAAGHFSPLKSCAEPSGPLECRLTLEEAYRFLRDVVPVLELEGFGVFVPQWWRDERPRLGLRLDIRLPDSRTEVGASTLRLDTLVEYDWRVALGDDALRPEEISQLAAAKAPLARVRGKWTEVQPSEVGAALRFIEQRRGGTMTVFEALRQSYYEDDLGAGLPMAGLWADERLTHLLGASDMHERVEPTEPPNQFCGTLRAYQLRGLEWLRFLAKHGLGACLADDMGLGKTIQLIALLLHEREADAKPGPTLLVVPMSLVGNWYRELARFAPSLKVMVHHGLERLTGEDFFEEVGRHDVVISTYGLTHRDHEHLAEVSWHRVALDEAQNIKNPAAKQSLAIRSLRAVQRVALTGTPVENRLSELWSIMEFLNPSYLGGARDFRRRFAIPIERYHDRDRAERLRRLIRPFVLRRRKDDPAIVDDLPEKMEMKVFCNLTKEQAALYEALVGDMLGQIDRAGGIQRRGLILATLTKLKQICNHPVHFLADESSLAQRSGKCERLAEMLEEVVAEGHRALVFTQFRTMGSLLQSLLQDSLDREILFLHGGTTQKNRDRLIERFQAGGEDTPVFILSLKAGGFGLNLTAANHVFHFDRWWNPAVEDQATDRAHRIGQDKQVQVHKFVCIGTLEERIDDMIERKRVLAENIVGSGEEWITELSTSALRELVALSREAVAED